MEFLITVTPIVALFLLRPSYRRFELGTYRPSQSLGIAAFLIVYMALAWVGSLAWDHRLPDALQEGPLGVVTGYLALLLFGAIFVVPIVLGALLAQAVAGAWWALDRRRA